jgi:hypothetical protein
MQWFRHSRLGLQNLRTSVFERQLFSASAASVTLPHSPLAAFEALLLASAFSTIIWTLLTVALLRLG